MSEQTANLCTTDACESLRQRLAKHEDAEGNPIAQPAVVVLPDPKKEIVAWGRDMGGNYDEGHADGWNDALDEVARLNSSPVSAGGVDERAAFEAWYLGHFYMGDKQCGLEWLSTEPCGGYRHQHPAEQWIVWQARAALSAPSHGEQVRHMVPDGWRPVPVESLSNILRLIDPEPVRLPSGKTMVFENPLAAALMTRISAEVRAMLAATPSAGSQEQGE